MKFSIEVMPGETPTLCLLIATLALGSASAEYGACEHRRTWWNRELGACLPCTRCEPQMAVSLPCEIHRDTVCQPLHHVRILPLEIPRNNDSDLDYYYEKYVDDYGEVNDDEVQWDVQTTTLSVAACCCVVFFIVVLYLSLHHSKQWKVLKQALRSDFQDLSAKLKLMEAGESPAEPVVPTNHHIYCNIHVTKDTLLAFQAKETLVNKYGKYDVESVLGPIRPNRRQKRKKGLGNVYTQEKHPS